MKHRIERFSPHQNGKVIAVLTGAVSVLFVAPLMLFMFFRLPRAEAPPAFFCLVLPLGCSTEMATGYEARGQEKK